MGIVSTTLYNFANREKTVKCYVCDNTQAWVEWPQLACAHCGESLRDNW